MIQEPLLMQSQSGAFNCDTIIQHEVSKLCDRYKLKNAIELGCCIGYTAAWLAAQFEQVRTVEINENFLNIAKINRLNALPNVTTYLGDSITKLAEMLEGWGDDTFIFVDSHWGEITPAPQELDIIATHGIKPVIAVHDFQVPNHPELGYDCYDGDKPFNFTWLKPNLDKIYGEGGYNHYYNDEAEGAMRGMLYVVPLK